MVADVVKSFGAKWELLHNEALKPHLAKGTWKKFGVKNPVTIHPVSPKISTTFKVVDRVEKDDGSRTKK